MAWIPGGIGGVTNKSTNVVTGRTRVTGRPTAASIIVGGAIQKAFNDPNLVGSQNTIFNFDGSSFSSSSSGGGSGVNPLAAGANKAAALQLEETASTRRLGLRKKQRSRSVIY